MSQADVPTDDQGNPARLPASPVRVMPPPPKGWSWELRIDVAQDRGGLWTFKNHPFTWLTGNPSGWSGELEFLRIPGGREWDNLELSKATTEVIVESAINAAEHILRELGEVPGKRTELQAKADDLSARLGIKVSVE